MMLPCGCPSEYPDWDGRDVDLGGQAVISLGIPMLFHMPLAYEAYLQRQQQEVERLDLKEQWPGFILTRTGFLRGSIMRLLTSGDSPSHRVTLLPRPFNLHAALHRGDVGTMRNVVKDMQLALLERARIPKELYLSYLTCPTCEEERGGARVLLARRWEESSLLKKARKPKSAPPTPQR
jgi:hypothetical protein